MAQTSGFFNATMVEGVPDRAYSAVDFANYFASFIGDGVFAHNLEELSVIPGLTNMQVIVKPGRAFCKGYWFDNSSDVELSLSSNSGVSRPRWDAVVLTFNQNTRVAELSIFMGTSALSYEDGKAYIYENLQRADSIYQLCLAIVKVPANATTYIVSAADIYDVRAEEYCGWVTGLVDQLDTSTIVTQMQADFLAWFDDMKDQLSTDAAGALQNQINSIISGQTVTGYTNAIKETNNGEKLKFWVGTTAEYNAIPTKLNNVLYIKTDDTTAEDVNSNIERLNEQMSALSEAAVAHDFDEVGSSMSIPANKTEANAESIITSTIPAEAFPLIKVYETEERANTNVKYKIKAVQTHWSGGEYYPDKLFIRYKVLVWNEGSAVANVAANIGYLMAGGEA